MAEVLVRFDADVASADDTTWIARACGREGRSGLWEGWLEFEPKDDGQPVQTERETTQPNRDDLLYWASHLTAAYLESALRRAVEPRRPAARSTPEVEARPFFGGPAERPG
ncbi:MAG: hypothetical protein ACRELV_05090 [Longimicrobiales bacterium]